MGFRCGVGCVWVCVGKNSSSRSRVNALKHCCQISKAKKKILRAVEDAIRAGNMSSWQLFGAACVRCGSCSEGGAEQGTVSSPTRILFVCLFVFILFGFYFLPAFLLDLVFLVADFSTT